MTINICKTEGTLGSISLSPDNVLVNTGDVKYTIFVSSETEQIDLNGQFKINSTNVKTGNFVFKFNEAEKILYNIKELEDGFSFTFNSNLDKINFNLSIEDFTSIYNAQIIIDARSSGYGSYLASLRIEPPLKVLDEIEEEIEGAATISPVIDIIKTKPSLINEYNFYLKDFEETSLNENQLLNININNRSIDIINYFKNKPIAKTYPNFILHSNDYMLELYPTLDKQKFLFPMFMEFKFETDNTKTLLTSFLKKIGILEYFCYFYIKNINNIQRNRSTRNIRRRTNTSFNTIKNEILNSNFRNFNSIEFIGNIKKIKSFLNKSFQKTILIKLLEKQIEELPQILSNQILMYRVDKLKDSVLINTQYFINNFENKEIVTFDTQLKYDTEYEYQVFKIQTDNIGRIIETEIKDYMVKAKIIDSPPLPPDVNYIPYKGIDDQVLINLNASVGRYADYPTIIRDSDITIFNKILNNSIYSKDISNENKIQFEADDANIQYEIFRLETPPSSYKDFEKSIQILTNNASILDNIKPNTKYYYIVRSVDVHGNISNPTKPIQLEIINENGIIYLNKKEYVFGEESRIISKLFKNTINIKPSKQQLQINPSLSYDSKPNATTAKEINLILGKKEVSVWNKPFLMRITSKMTGKKIDIKFKFTYSQPK